MLQKTASEGHDPAAKHPTPSGCVAFNKSLSKVPMPRMHEGAC